MMIVRQACHTIEANKQTSKENCAQHTLTDIASQSRARHTRLVGFCVVHHLLSGIFNVLRAPS